MAGGLRGASTAKPVGNLEGTLQNHSGDLEGTPQNHSGNLGGTNQTHNGNLTGTLQITMETSGRHLKIAVGT